MRGGSSFTSSSKYSFILFFTCVGALNSARANRLRSSGCHLGFFLSVIIFLFVSSRCAEDLCTPKPLKPLKDFPQNSQLNPESVVVLEAWEPSVLCCVKVEKGDGPLDGGIVIPPLFIFKLFILLPVEGTPLGVV